jgi:hypothetical protein
MCAARGTVREALECGGDRATALVGRGTASVARTKQASHAAGRHDSTTLPKRWPCHRTPKCFARNECHTAAMARNAVAMERNAVTSQCHLAATLRSPFTTPRRTATHPASRCGDAAPHCDTPASRCGDAAPHCDTPASRCGDAAPHCDTPASRCGDAASHCDTPRVTLRRCRAALRHTRVTLRRCRVALRHTPRHAAATPRRTATHPASRCGDATPHCDTPRVALWRCRASNALNLSICKRTRMERWRLAGWLGGVLAAGWEAARVVGTSRIRGVPGAPRQPPLG